MPRDKVEVVRQAVDAYNSRELDAWFAELATPDFEWWPALTRAFEGGCYQGREGVERFVADTRENWEELQTIAEQFRDLGDRVLVLGRLRGRGKASGVPVDQPYVGIFDFRGAGSGATGCTSIVPRDCGRQVCPSRRAQASYGRHLSSCLPWA